MASSNQALRVAHLIPYLGRAQGGPVLNLSECSKAQLDQGLRVSIFSTTRASDGALAPVDSRATLVTEAAPGWGPLRKCPSLWERALAARFDILHSHGLWTDVNRLAAQMARRRNIPHLLTPCGMLAQGALRHHWWNKVPARIWFQQRALKKAACLQAQSEIEVQQIREFGLRNPVALIPAAVPARPPTHAMSAPEFRSLFRVPAERRIVLYLGRLHPVKGLPRLLQAWAQIQQSVVRGQLSSGPLSCSPLSCSPLSRGPLSSGPLSCSPLSCSPLSGGSWSRGLSSGTWQLVLAGPDEAGHRRDYEARAAELGCSNSVIFTGALDGYQKWGALDAAELFVMPSDFENFGVAIAEAMQSGLPVITTTGTPWQELPAQGVGWCVEPTVDALSTGFAGGTGHAGGSEESHGAASGRIRKAVSSRPGRRGFDPRLRVAPQARGAAQVCGVMNRRRGAGGSAERPSAIASRR